MHKIIEKNKTDMPVDGVKVYRVEPNEQVIAELMEKNPNEMKKKIVRYRILDVERKLPEILAKRGYTLADLPRLFDEKQLLNEDDKRKMAQNNKKIEIIFSLQQLLVALDISEYDLQAAHEFVNPYYIKSTKNKKRK